LKGVGDQVVRYCGECGDKFSKVQRVLKLQKAILSLITFLFSVLLILMGVKIFHLHKINMRGEGIEGHLTKPEDLRFILKTVMASSDPEGTIQEF
jgi:hypothetical protein